MAEATALACPHCGGPAPSGHARCEYCRGPLETVRCAGCFRLSSPDALHCSGCGRVLGLQPINVDEPLSCPRCSTPCLAFDGAPGVLYECEACGGQFVEHFLLRELLERRQVLGSVVARPPRRPNPLSDAVRYVPCPCCKELMNRKNFANSSGVVVDVCSRHGMWFDRGELALVLAFVESGGLARARHKVDYDRPARRVPPRPASLSGPSDPAPPLRDTLTDVGDGVVALAIAVAELLEGALKTR